MDRTLTNTFFPLIPTNKHYGGDISVSSYKCYNFQTKSFDVLFEFALLISCPTSLAYSAALSCESEKVSQEKKKKITSPK